MLRTQKSLKRKLPVVLITTCFSLMLLSAANGQPDETDPQRWKRVKTWSGTFTYNCNDSRTDTVDGGTIDYYWNDRIEGSFTLGSLTSSASTTYAWNGSGTCQGTISEETVVSDEEGGSCTTTWYRMQPPLLVPNPGYSLSINLRDGTYFVQAETVQWPVKITTCCDGDCSTMDFTYGNGGINSFFQPLPSSGFSLKGSYDAELLIGDGTLTATITWDIQATEISPPPPSSCPIRNNIENQHHLGLLYALRNRMAGSETGRTFASLYYEHAAEVSTLLLHNPDLRERLRKIVVIYASSAGQPAAGEPVAVPYELIEQTECFLEELKPDASLTLLQTIDYALDTMHERTLLKELGVTVDEVVFK